MQASYNTDEEDGVEHMLAPPAAGVASPVVMAIDSPDVGHTPSPQVGGDSVNNTPRTPRGQTVSTATDEESISEWEIEKQRVTYLLYPFRLNIF